MKFRLHCTRLHWMVVSCMTLCFVASGITLRAQSQPTPTVPVINAELGSCSVQFTVQDGAGKPVSGARVRVRIAYGFMSLRKLDLETSTGSEGKVRFEGLPGNLKKALFFRASKDKLEGTAFYDAGKNCSAQHTIVMVPRKEESDTNDATDNPPEQ
jgi:hypothetical protein